ncbi:acyl-coenzyme A thioesterase 9, mitochondrial-like isoform X2 [Lineus longissimus]|uniref:acyl-coenzyme A thioesterase 9, mitochondrial-like isoform X2 n=1 Tax=Lineus longissimus TaxID=88925 RepID=UPI002B4DB3A2
MSAPCQKIFGNIFRFKTSFSAVCSRNIAAKTSPSLASDLKWNVASQRYSSSGGSSSQHFFVKDANIPTPVQLRVKLKELIGQQQLWSEKHSEQSSTPLPEATSQADLPMRTMSDSYWEALIPLGSNTALRDMYLNFHKTVRFGKIMEDLDTFAGLIAYIHNEPSPKVTRGTLSIVTAYVSRIDLREKLIRSDCDMKLTGRVTWVGKTSMEVTMHLLQETEKDKWLQLLTAKFLMVARDQNKKAAFVNPLKATTPEEEEILKMGEANKEQRMLEASQSLLKTIPTKDESVLVHDMFVSTLDPSVHSFRHRVLPKDAIWMNDGALKTVIICHPQERNIHNKIFGGFLMRQAFELAWANANVFSQRRPFIIAVDDIAFKRVVAIGSLLFLSSQVVYTSGTKLQIRVHAEVVDPMVGEQETTNTFHFTFSTIGNVPTVVPNSYAETMLYLDGKRHFDESMKYVSSDEEIGL